MRFSGSPAWVEAAMGRTPVILAIFHFHLFLLNFFNKMHEPNHEHDAMTIIASKRIIHDNQKARLGKRTPRTRGGSDYCPKAGNSIKK